jgi:hypothetical protein
VDRHDEREVGRKKRTKDRMTEIEEGFPPVFTDSCQIIPQARHEPHSLKSTKLKTSKAWT